MSVVSTKILDHILHLAPPGTLQESVHAFRELGFTVIPGGRHNTGLTENALVMFQDGTYLALVHYIENPPPDKNRGPWVKKQSGWFDYWFLGNGGSPSIAEAINMRAGEERASVRYTPEVKGSRKREDDMLSEWIVTGYEGEMNERGRLPFFCGDLTPREWRAPLEPPSNAVHQNGVTGIAYTKILVDSESYETTVNDLTAVLGATPDVSTSTQATWTLDRPPLHVNNKDIPQLFVFAAQDDQDRLWLQQRGPGVYEVGFRVSGAGPSPVSGSSTHGRIAWVVQEDK